ncbi:MAG TPA: CDP-glycerol glycerophosphotransferase family protein [Microbacterium sp.]|uniref:CDP-glycerol glycerophosphotransferase family protein n=1 Tax=Microbacterium sp. TaxID=51671 RepID=UPI002B583B7D|nr:CDP-glycerol glycerophosphotransferase family protein [Microbacterium sp.]HWI32072.1 CDP-glycerol glycerophosphotransferase family protein [Microbacterium sp.]
MASFSFGAGNAQKLVRIPLYALGRLATLFIPRRPGAWAFGCGAGIGDGALALWELVADQGHTDAIWLTGSPREAADAAARGIPSADKHSLQGFWRTARAGVVVVTHGFGDVNRYAVSGSFLVQLWHGIPLKRIGLDSPETVRSGILPGSRLVRTALATMYRGATRRIHVIPAASHLARGRLESAFALADDRVPVTGEPRVDVLSLGTEQERRATARAMVASLVGGIPNGARLVLYAPTWRDGEADPAVPTAGEWAALVATLERRDAVLLVRSHPLGAGEYAPPIDTDRVRMLGSGILPDVTPVLPAIDVLVTDYSSLAFDAALVPLPVVYLAPDVAAYAARRGFYGAYTDVAGPDYATAWPEATAQLDAVLGDEVVCAERTKRSVRLSARVHAHRDGGNTRRVYRAIMSRAGAAAGLSKGAP